MRTFSLVLVLTIAIAGCSQAVGEPRSAEGPLVLELFTSQGCSSCPPADRLLSQLATTAGKRPLAPLSFHVDYWDDLGWPDPYALPAWTQRQRSYARALGDNRVYTPELVIGGAKGLVGSQRLPVTAAVLAAPHPALLPVTATWDATTLTVTATAPDDADVLVAVWQTQTETKVRRGENAGETLRSARVVRRLDRVATAGKRGTVKVKVDPSWGTVGAVAFAQRRDLVITASALVPGP